MYLWRVFGLLHWVCIGAFGMMGCSAKWDLEVWKLGDQDIATQSMFTLEVVTPAGCEISFPIRIPEPCEDTGYEGPPPKVLDVDVDCDVIDCGRITIENKSIHLWARSAEHWPSLGNGRIYSEVFVTAIDGDGDTVELRTAVPIVVPDEVRMYENQCSLPDESPRGEESGRQWRKKFFLMPNAKIEFGLELFADGKILQSRKYEGFVTSGQGELVREEDTYPYTTTTWAYTAPATPGQFDATIINRGSIVRDTDLIGTDFSLAVTTRESAATQSLEMQFDPLSPLPIGGQWMCYNTITIMPHLAGETSCFSTSAMPIDLRVTTPDVCKIKPSLSGYRGWIEHADGNSDFQLESCHIEATLASEGLSVATVLESCL